MLNLQRLTYYVDQLVESVLDVIRRGRVTIDNTTEDKNGQPTEKASERKIMRGSVLAELAKSCLNLAPFCVTVLT